MCLWFTFSASYTSAFHWYSFIFQAIASLSRVAQTPQGLEALLAGNLLADLKSIMVKSDIIRYRVYEARVFCFSGVQAIG